jgi:uncharacterized membrane protein YqhA
MAIISFLFATLLLFGFNVLSQIVSYSSQIKETGKISVVSMVTSVVTLLLITWNIFAIISYFN